MPVPESTPTPAPMPGAEPAPQAAPAPTAPRTPLKPEGPISYEDESEELLFGPTTRPNEAMAVAAAGATQVPPRPQGLENFLPVIAEAAAQPDAPEEARRFARILAYHLGREA